MGFAFINGNSARCRDCKWFVNTGKLTLDDWHDGTCGNKKHVKTHGGGAGRVNADQMTCFDSEPKEAQMDLWEADNDQS